MRKIFVRNRRAADELEIFLVAAVTTILLIRLFLALTGYPQLGGGKLHIAHMLWGGLGMLVAILLRLIFLGKWVEYASAFLGGVGFGAFIDEVGKFVTADNNYFFTPSFSLMYIIFVLIYLASHWALTSNAYSRTEYLMNAVNDLQEYRNGYLREDERVEVDHLLNRADRENPLVRTLGDFVDSVETEPASGPGIYQRLKARLEKVYFRVIETRHFALLLNLFFIIQLLVTVSDILLEVLYPNGIDRNYESPSTSEILLMISSGISAVFIFLGVIRLRRSRIGAYRMFERAMLVNILVSQIFLFTINQLSAITGLLFSLLVLSALRFLIEVERGKEFQAATIA